MTKTALIFGVTGQDGYYLSKYLLDKGYEVWGSFRPATKQKRVVKGVRCLAADLTDSGSVYEIINSCEPDEVYNLAGLVDVNKSFDMPEYCLNVNGLGTLRILEALNKFHGETRFFNACTVAKPSSIYGISKDLSQKLVKCYRDNYGMYAVNGIMGNHDSPYRNNGAVTKKIAKGVAKIAKGLKDKLYLGNTSSVRIWGHAKDYAPYMWKCLQHKEAKDHYIEIGTEAPVSDLIKYAFSYVRMDSFDDKVEIDPMLVRSPAKSELYHLHTIARKNDYLRKLMEEMVEYELSALQ